MKLHVLRYWVQEFTQLKPVKRRGNRRYYQHHEVLLIRRIRELLYEQGFTNSGARNKLNERGARNVIVAETVPEVESGVMTPPIDIESIRSELEEIRSLLTIVKKE